MRDSVPTRARVILPPVVAVGACIAFFGGFQVLAGGAHALPIDDDAPPVAIGDQQEADAPATFRAFVPGSTAKGPELNAVDETFVVAAEGRPHFTSPLAAWTGVTDRFGVPRGEGIYHSGIDLGLRLHPSSRVVASCPGFVVAVGWSGGYGNRVVVDCGDGWDTLYAHLSLPLAVPGMFVPRGAVLGISGSTGYSTGEHLHFEIRRNGVPVDPERYIDFGLQPGPAVLGPLAGDPAWSASPAPPPTPAADPQPATATDDASPPAAPTEAPGAADPTDTVPTPESGPPAEETPSPEPTAATPIPTPAPPEQVPQPTPDPATSPSPEPTPDPATSPSPEPTPQPTASASPSPQPTPTPTRSLPWAPTGLDDAGDAPTATAD